MNVSFGKQSKEGYTYADLFVAVGTNGSFPSKVILQNVKEAEINGFGPINDKLPFRCVEHAETTKMDNDVKIRLQDTILIGIPKDEIQ